MAAPLRIALAGLGTVGGGVIRLLTTNGPLIARRAGRPIEIAAVCARDRSKDRGFDLSPYAWEDDPTMLAARDDVDVVVELVGGADGSALALARRTLASGKGLVTANKAMVAHHGMELAALAEAANDGRGAPFRFEAAVAGGLVVEDSEHVDRFSFTHALVRETLYERPIASRRVRLHRRVAEALEFSPLPVRAGG